MERKLSLPLEHWGFERWPFRGAATADQFYPTAGNSEALSRIEYLVDSRRRLGALLGDSGVGKTLVLQVAARRLARQRRAIVLLSALGVTAGEFLWNVAAGLPSAPGRDADTGRLWRHIADRITENGLQQMDTLLLVDDFGHAGPELANQLVRLSRLDSSAAARWTIVLAAEAAQAARWNSTLRNLMDLRIDVRTWNAADTVGYVQTALLDAGCMEPVFEESALDRLHDLAEGVPRRIARLADLALLAGAAAGLHSIDADAVEAAQEEIAWPEPAVVY